MTQPNLKPVFKLFEEPCIAVLFGRIFERELKSFIFVA
jgi:hypothetical protein